MLNDSSSLQAFQTAAGVSASSLSILIRVVLLVGIFLWAAWCVPQFYKHAKHHEHMSSLLEKCVQLLIIVSLMIAIVAI